MRYFKHKEIKRYAVLLMSALYVGPREQPDDYLEEYAAFRRCHSQRVYTCPMTRFLSMYDEISEDEFKSTVDVEECFSEERKTVNEIIGLSSAYMKPLDGDIQKMIDEDFWKLVGE